MRYTSIGNYVSKSHKKKADPGSALVLVQARIPSEARDRLRQKMAADGLASEAAYLRRLVLRDVGMAK